MTAACCLPTLKNEQQKRGLSPLSMSNKNNNIDKYQ